MLVHSPNRPVKVRRGRKGEGQTESIAFTVNRKNSMRQIFWAALVLILGFVAFSLERTSQAVMMVGGLYALCVVFASRLSFTYAEYVVATICSALSLSGLIDVDIDQLGWSDATDRLLVLLAIWVAAFLSMLWDKPQSGGYGTRANQRRSRSRVLRAEVTTSEEFDESGKFSQENLDDLSQLNQELMQKNYELETLMNVVSHDLRSPLVNIQGFSKELSDSCERLRGTMTDGVRSGRAVSDVAQLLDEEIPEAIRYIRAGAEKINSVLSGILQFSRLGRLSLNSERVNVNALVSGIATVMEYQLKEKRVLLQIDDLPHCMGDEILVSQVFSNLIENAYKYLDSARPGVIHLSGKIKDGKSVYAIKDNGIGIQPDHQGKIFEMFHRLDPKEGSGEGLGLTIVRRIVERHQGEIWVESEFDVGTTFFLSLPSATTVLKEG